ncbi:MAG: hypothetical protein LC099_05315 [Anaerolineales bacterium]|nr:hypothetical protein [Anaerolineales bacterium]
MSDFFEKVSSQVDPFKKLASAIPGFKGYVERQNRRDADKLLRDTVARRFEERWTRASNLQAEMVSAGQLMYVDDMEKASLALRTFIDKIKTAARGYSGMFDAVKINEDELERLYKFDAAFLDLANDVSNALDNVEASMGDESALPAAIRHITSIARNAVELFERRSEIVTGDQ